MVFIIPVELVFFSFNWLEADKCLVKRKRDCDIKAAKMSNEKVVIEIIDKIRDYGIIFAFHDDESAGQGMC